MSTEQLTSFKVFTLFKHGKFSTAVVSHTKIYSLRRLFSWLIKSEDEVNFWFNLFLFSSVISLILAKN